MYFKTLYLFQSLFHQMFKSFSPVPNILCSDSSDICDKQIYTVYFQSSKYVCIYRTSKIKPDLRKSEFFSLDHYCVIFIFETYIFVVQFSDHLPPLHARFNGKLFFFLYATVLDKPYYNECCMLLGPIYGFNSFALRKKSDTFYIPTSGVHLGDVLLM